MGEDKGADFCMWAKRDGESDGIADIQIAYSLDEERVLRNDGYKARRRRRRMMMMMMMMVTTMDDDEDDKEDEEEEEDGDQH
jgi:hypothetical protein